MKQLYITTPRLIIRNLKVSDLPDFYIYRSNPDIARYQGFETMSTEQANNFIKEHTNKTFGKPGEWVQYGLEYKETGKIVGDTAIKTDAQNYEIAEIGITISHLEQKKGYAKEAFTGILNFLFKTTSVIEIKETVDADNIASINLLKSLGFIQHGPIVENVYFKGKWGSEVHFVLHKEKWISKE